MGKATFRQIRVTFTEERSRVSISVMAKPLTAEWTERHTVLRGSVMKPWVQPLETYEDVLLAVVVLIEEEMLRRTEN